MYIGCQCAGQSINNIIHGYMHQPQSIKGIVVMYFIHPLGVLRLQTRLFVSACVVFSGAYASSALSRHDMSRRFRGGEPLLRFLVSDGCGILHRRLFHKYWLLRFSPPHERPKLPFPSPFLPAHALPLAAFPRALPCDQCRLAPLIVGTFQLPIDYQVQHPTGSSTCFAAVLRQSTIINISVLHVTHDHCHVLYPDRLTDTVRFTAYRSSAFPQFGLRFR